MTYSTARPDVPVTDGGKIRRLREGRLKISASQFARRVGVKPQSMINIERDHRSASLGLLSRIAAELNVPLESLLREPGSDEGDAEPNGAAA